MLFQVVSMNNETNPIRSKAEQGALEAFPTDALGWLLDPGGNAGAR